MSRREWYAWGYVLWLMFGLFGVLIVFAPYRMGLATAPTWPWIVAGFVCGLLGFVVLEVWYERRRCEQ